MKRKLSRNYSLSVVVPFIAVLIGLVALAALAQTPRTAQPSEKPHSSFAPPRVRDTDDAPTVPSTRDKLREGPMDGNPLFLMPAVTYDSGGTATMSLAVADVNGDGKPDVVVANNGTGTVGVLLGNGDGTFQAAVTYGSGGSGAPLGNWTTMSVAIADVNGDGKLDIVVTNELSSNVGVLLGNGDGTFQPAVTSPTDPYPLWVAVGDFNGDGKPDLAVTVGGYLPCEGYSVGVMLGNGDGTFQAPVDYASGGNCPSSVAVADLNGDGKLDLAVANMCAPPYCSVEDVAVLLGNGDGTFQPAVTYLLGAGAMAFPSVAIADLNGDGKPDLAVGSVCVNFNCGAAIAVLLGNGDGTFQPAVLYPTDGPSYGVAIGDVNGDGKPDLLAADWYSTFAIVLLGNGDGTFQPAQYYPSGGDSPDQVAIADVNGDGWPDVLVMNSAYGAPQEDGSVGVLLNNIEAPPSTTTLVSSVNPVNVKEVVTYTASVATQSGGSLSGIVTFQDGGNQIASVTIANNQAAYSTSYTKNQLGLHTITATYWGEFGVATGSVSAPLLEYVRDLPTRTVVTTSGSPSQLGQAVTFTATVTAKKGVIPDGELVTFYDGKNMLGSVPLANEQAAYTTSTLKAKTHTIRAVYPGDSTFEPSHGTVTQVVEK